MHGPGANKQTNEQVTSDPVKEDDDSTRSESVTGGGGRALPDVPLHSRLSGSFAAASIGSSVPTIRSRVTVVCAECKKQKLRCDRRIPCESCVKRNTVSRCIYTPAAIEKVDMTSINNRLRVVEGSLNALGVPTQGFQQTHLPHPQCNPHQPGVFPFLTTGGMGTSLPGAQATTYPVNPGPPRFAFSSDFADGVGLCPPPPRILATSNDEGCGSTVAPLSDVVKLWVREVIEEIGEGSPLAMVIPSNGARSSLGHPQPPNRNLGTSKHLKLDLEPIDRECKGGYSAFGCRAKHVLDTRQWLELHAGLGISSIIPEVSQQPCPEMTTGETISKNPVAANCISNVYTPITTHLLAQFPCRRNRREMLVRLGQVYLVEGFNCMPFGAFCARIEALFSPAFGENPERVDASRETTPALSAIAEAAAGLAVGALLWATEPTADTTSNAKVLRRIVLRLMEQSVHWIDPGDQTGPMNEVTPDRPHAEAAFALYRLAQLAIAIHTTRHGHAAQDVSIIHTRILNSYYLIIAHSTCGGLPHSLLPPELPSLVGSLVWEARAMGLGIDPDEFDPLDEVSSVDHGTGSSFKREDVDETSPSQGKRMCLFMKEMRRRLWWWVVWLDLFVSDAYGYNATILPDEFSTRLPAIVDDTSFRPDSDTLPPPDNACLEKTNIFYFSKVRIFEIIKHASLRVFRGGIVPNIPDFRDTLAATQKLADEITQWFEDLPEHYKLDAIDNESPPVTFSRTPMTSLRPPSEVEEERKTIKAILVCQRCDMAFHGYHTLLRLYMPRLPSSFSSLSRHANTSSRIGDKVVPADQQLVELRAVQPALAVVQAAEMQMAFAPDLSRGTLHMHMFPQRLFDAAVVLAHTAIQQPLYTAPVVTEAVRSARDVLSHILNSDTLQDPGSIDNKRSKSAEAELVIDTLLKRAERAMTQSTPVVAGRKRKHEDIESDTTRFDSPFRFPFLGTGIVNVYRPSVQTIAPCEEGERGGLTGTTSQPSTTSGLRSSRVAQGSDSCSRHSSDAGSGRQGKTVPVVSIRQRIRDRRNDRTAVDASRTESSSVDPGFRAAQPFLLPPRPPSQQTYSAGPSTSSSPFFPSESVSASPVSPASQYGGSNGTQRMNRGADYPLRVNDSPRSIHSVGAASLERPLTLPSTYHYPVPNIGGPSYTVPVPLQHRRDHLDGTMVAGPAGYGVDSTHLSQNIHVIQDDQRGSGVQQWPSSNFEDQQHESLATPSPHPAGAYPHDQNTQRHPPPPWTTGENMNSAPMAPPWNVGLFNDWNHNSQ